jgi:putative ABC transport system permease protein
LLKLALRNILRQRARAGLTLAAIVLGVASIVLSGGFVEDILLQLREATIRSQLGHLQVYKHGRSANTARPPTDYIIEDPAKVASAIAGIPGLVLQARRLSFSGLITNGRGELPMLAEGIEAQPEARIGSAMTMLSGRPLNAEDRFAVVVGEGLSNAFKIKVGERVNLVVSTREGAVNTLDFQVVGIFRTLSKDYDARAVRMPLHTAQELIATSGVTSIVVLLAQTELTQPARLALEARLPQAEFEVRTWQELASFYNNTAALYQRQFGVLQAIIVALVLLGVANSVNMTLHERISEFGVMRALGRTASHVFKLAMLETALLGLIGAAIGVAIGSALALAVSAVGIPMPPPPNSESGFNAAIQLVPSVLIAAFGLGVLASVAAALMPARRLAQIPVVEALRRSI